MTSRMNVMRPLDFIAVAVASSAIKSGAVDLGGLTPVGIITSTATTPVATATMIFGFEGYTLAAPSATGGTYYTLKISQTTNLTVSVNSTAGQWVTFTPTVSHRFRGVNRIRLTINDSAASAFTMTSAATFTIVVAQF